MKERFRDVRGHPIYRVSNFGRVQNTSSGKFLRGWNCRSGRNYVDLNGKRIMRAKLVLRHFNPSQLGKDYAIHINNLLTDHRSKNLKWGTLGDVKRMFNTIKNKRRGVYHYPFGNKPWRAVIKINNRAKTIGYYETEKQAEDAYISKYIEQYGYIPFVS